jgi:hypothetical protein
MVIVNGSDRWLRFAFGPLLAHGGFRGASWWEGKVRDAGFEVSESGAVPASYYLLARKKTS